MKRFFLIAIALTAGLAAWAQKPAGTKRVESNVLLGAGLFGETGNRARNVFPGAVLRLSYGLDVRLGGPWSLMPGAGIRAQMGEINHIGWVGGDPEGMSQADFFVVPRYHLDADGTRIVLGLGPALSYMVGPDTYYIDADPRDPLNGKEKFNRFDLGLQPSLIFRHGRHFQWGFEANVGLLNAMRQYPEYSRTGSIHLHYLTLTCGWHF